MKTTWQLNGKTAVLEPVGRFDAHTAPSVAASLEDILQSQIANIVVNLGQVNFVDSTALATLVQGMKRCRQAGGDLSLCCLSQPVRIIFELTRLDRAFTIFDTETEAMHAFGS